MGGPTNERPGSDHVTYGPMRGLKKVDMKRGHIDIYMDIATTRKNWPKGRFFEKA